MEIDFIWIFSYLLLGGIVGFFAGLLGIGGGGFMVPILTTLFLMQGIPVENVVHLALGTSMASIVATSFLSMRAHHKMGTVEWPIVWKFLPGIIIGTFSATFIVTYLNTLFLSIFFTIYMAYISIQMLASKNKPKPTRILPSTLKISAVGGIIGAVSSMVSIGGGSMMVPYLSWHNVDFKKAISTSATIGFPLSLAGSAGFILNGLDTSIEQPFISGFVHLVAVFCIALVSVVLVPIGAKLSSTLPVIKLRKTFAVLLLLFSAQMLFSVLQNY
jgi:uncharacterized membrane protein YfcA